MLSIKLSHNSDVARRWKFRRRITLRLDELRLRYRHRMILKLKKRLIMRLDRELQHNKLAKK